MVVVLPWDDLAELFFDGLAVGQRRPRVAVRLAGASVEPDLHRDVAVELHVPQRLHDAEPIDLALAWRQPVGVGEVDVPEVRAHLVRVVRAGLVPVQRVIGVEHDTHVVPAAVGAQLQRVVGRVDQVAVGRRRLDAQGDTPLGRVLGDVGDRGERPLVRLLPLGAEHAPAGDVQHALRAEVGGQVDHLLVVRDGGRAFLRQR